MHTDRLSLPAPFEHRHADVNDVSALVEERLTAGQRAALAQET